LKDEEIKLRVTKDFKDKIKAEADKRNISVSMFVRNCCLEVLKKQYLEDDKSIQIRRILHEQLKIFVSDSRIRSRLVEAIVKEISRLE